MLDIYREAASLRYFTGAPESLAEATGAAVMADDAPLRLLLGDVLGAPEVVSWVDPITEAVGRRMQNLDGALGRRAARWGHTRAGELTSWLSLLAAVQGRLSEQRAPELAHAHAWTLAQLEHAVSAVRLGTPSETATLAADDIAATFATYARAIGDLEPDSSREVPSSRPRPVQTAANDGSASNGNAAQTRWAREQDAKRRELRARVIAWLATRLGIPIGEVEPGRSFADHGLDSVASVELAKTLSDELGRELDATLVWSFATIDALAEYLVRPQPDAERAAPELAPSTSVRSTESGSVEARIAETSLDETVARLEQELGWRS